MRRRDAGGRGGAPMIDIAVLPAFIAASAVVILVPGSDVFLLLRLSLAQGMGAGLRALAGIHLGNLVQAALMVSGIGLLVSRIPAAVLALKIVGAAYLLYLAVVSLRAALRKPPSSSTNPAPDPNDDARRADQPIPRAFRQGFLTNVTNPKVLLFFVAFFPQFLGSATLVPLQLLVLSTVFIVLAIVWELVVVFAAARIGAVMTSPRFLIGMDLVCALAFTALAISLVVTTV